MDVAAGRHQDVIKANRRKSVLLLVANEFLLFIVGGMVGYWFSRNVWGALVGGSALTAVGLLSAWYAPSTAAALSHAHQVAPGELVEVRSSLENVALAAGMPVPNLYLVTDPAPNAFAFGWKPENCGVAVTSGLLMTLSKRELEGVLAHELSHIDNRDTQMMTMAVGTFGILAVTADFFWRFGFLFGGGRRRSSSSSGGDSGLILLLVTLVVTVLAVLASRLLMMAVSRKREALADASAVDLLRDPDGLRRALEKLESNTTVVQAKSRAIAHLWIESPLPQGKKSSWTDRLFDSHPPISDRIATLRQLEGLDPNGRGPVDLDSIVTASMKAAPPVSPTPIPQAPRLPSGTAGVSGPPLPAVTGVPAPAGAVAGWYPDPAGQANYRWWDGSRWTDSTG
jgi:heat shock protein HtpX